MCYLPMQHSKDLFYKGDNIEFVVICFLVCGVMILVRLHPKYDCLVSRFLQLKNIYTAFVSG